jgi:hypothetical protein
MGILAAKPFAEKLALRRSAPEGAYQFKGLVASLKRCPDTKRDDTVIRNAIMP